MTTPLPDPELTPEQRSTSNPVLLMTACVSAYIFVVGGLGSLDLLPPKIVGLLVLLGGGATVFFGVYTKGKTAPWQDVVAKATQSGLIVAGPAAQAPTGREVEVRATGTGEVVAPPAVAPEDQGDQGGPEAPAS